MLKALVRVILSQGIRDSGAVALLLFAWSGGSVNHGYLRACNGLPARGRFGSGI